METIEEIKARLRKNAKLFIELLDKYDFPYLYMMSHSNEHNINSVLDMVIYYVEQGETVSGATQLIEKFSPEKCGHDFD